MVKDNFRKYEKIFRILVDSINVKGKHYLYPEEEKKLFNDRVHVFEKVDGANVAIYKNADGKIFLQKRGSHIDNGHKQYIFFQNWCYEHYDMMKIIPNNFIVYGELMRCKHSIYYDKLSDWFLVFDIYDLGDENYYSWKDVELFCRLTGFTHVPLIYEGYITHKNQIINLIPKESKYGDIAEGLVIKNYKNGMYGKIVKEEFIKMIDIFWRNKPITYNRLKENER